MYSGNHERLPRAYGVGGLGLPEGLSQMDDEQFQELVDTLRKAASRRDAVKGLVAGVLVSVGVITDAARPARAQNRCKKNGKNCVEAQTLQYIVSGERGGGGNQRRGRRRRRD